MPLNTSIITQMQGPEDPQVRYQRALALQNALGQQQLQQQSLRAGQLQLQQAEQDQADQQKVRRAYMESGGDLEKLQQRAVQLGVGPNTLMKLKESLLKQQKELTELDEKKLDTHKKTTEIVGSATQAILQAPPEARPQLYAATVADLQAKGIVKPGELPEQYPGDEAIQVEANKARTAQQMIDAAFKEREVAATEKNAATNANRENRESAVSQAEQERKAFTEFAGKYAAADSPQAQQELLDAAPFKIARQFVGKTAEQARRMGMKPSEQAADDRAKEQAKETALRDQQAKANQNANLGLRQREVALQEKRYTADAEGIANLDYDPQTIRMMLRTNPGLMKQVKDVDPSFSMDTLDKKYDTLKEFTNTSAGKAGGQVQALNTLIHHADLFMEAADALKNGKFKPGNAAYNAISDMMGQPAPPNANLVAQFLAGEAGKVATGGVPTETAIKDMLKSMGNDSSPQQLYGSGQKLLQLAAGRMIPLKERVDDAKLTGKVQILGPDAQAILARRNMDLNTFRPKGASAATSPKIGDVVNVGGKSVKITAIHSDGTFDGTPQ